MADDDQNRWADLFWTLLTVALWLAAFVVAVVLVQMTFFD